MANGKDLSGNEYPPQAKEALISMSMAKIPISKTASDINLTLKLFTSLWS